MRIWVIFIGLTLLFFTRKIYGQPVNMNVHCAINYSLIEESESGPYRNVRLDIFFEGTGDTYYDGPCETPFARECAPDGDHIMIQNIDNPNDHGMPIPTRALEEFNDDGDSRFGEYSLDYSLSNLVYCTNHPHLCHYWDIHGEFRGSASVLMTLRNCGRWKIWYVVDYNSWYDIYRNRSLRDSRSIIIENNLPGYYGNENINLEQYVLDNALCYSTVTIDMGPCVSPPVDIASLHFGGYVQSNGSSGWNWLPQPKDSIGLIFQVNSLNNTPFRIMYQIWNVTMWQGQCMNSPVFNLTAPAPSGVDKDLSGIELDTSSAYKNLDVSVGMPNKYRFIYTINFLTIII